MCCFNRELWMNNLHVCNLKRLKKGGFSNFDNTAFFIKVLRSIWRVKSLFLFKGISVTSGVREWIDLYPFVEMVRLPEALVIIGQKVLVFLNIFIQKIIL